MLQGVNDDALGQVCLRQHLVIEAVVDDEVKGRTEVRYVAFERVVRVHRYLQTIEVQAIIRCKQSRNVGVFVAFYLACRETLCLEIGKGTVANGVERVGSMAFKHVRSLVVEIDILLFTVHHQPLC